MGWKKHLSPKPRKIRKAGGEKEGRKTFDLNLEKRGREERFGKKIGGRDGRGKRVVGPWV